MGIQKYIESPEHLEQLFEDYKTWVEENPIKKEVFVGGKGRREEQKLQRPLTIQGFTKYVFGKVGLVKLDDYFGNKESRYTEFAGVVTRIRVEIMADQIEGGLSGIYHHNLTARLNGLAEQQNKIEDKKVEVVIKRVAEKTIPAIEDAQVIQLPEIKKVGSNLL